MARYRTRPSYCTNPAGCPGGRCGKCAYNPRSGYAMFHYTPVSPAGQVLAFLFVLFLLSRLL